MLKTCIAASLMFTCGTVSWAQAPVAKLNGLDYSPFLTGQDPNRGSQVTYAQNYSRMQIVAPYTVWIRSFGSTGGLENTPAIARSLGLKVAANAWISSDLSQNTAEINNLIAAANAGHVDIAIVGSEAILRNDVTVTQLIAYMNQVRQAIPSGIPVVTADIWGTFISNPSLIAAADQVWANFYPYWEGTSISNSVCSLEQEYQQLKQASGSKTVVVSETGWPSAGDAVGAAVPSVANANLFALQFLTWASANSVPSFYFEAFNEDWKIDDEGPQGANWGIWDQNAAIKPGMDDFFKGQSASAVCDGVIPGPVAIAPIYVPPVGSSDAMEVQVTGVRPGDYVTATYIDVFGGWWTKPTFAQPTVAVNTDGTAKITIVSGGSDEEATEIETFLIPSGSVPPQASGGGKPTPSNSVASFDVSRTQSSISGAIQDDNGNPLAGVSICDTVLGCTTSAPDGKYSFYDITTSGTATLTVSYPNYVFAGSPATLMISSGNQVANFTGRATADLTIIASVFPNPVLPNSPISGTVTVSDAGPAPTPDAVLTLSIPASFASVNVSTSRGSCNTSVQPVTCDLGALPATALATVTFSAVTGGAGPYTVTASVTGPVPDPSTSNNTVSQSVTVVSLPPAPPSAGPAAPSSGSSGAGSTQVFTFTYSSAAGAGYLNEALALWNGAVSSSGGCFVQYFVAANALYLANDAGDAETGSALTPGTAGSLSNSQCTINGTGSSVSSAGTMLSLTLSVSFAPTFAGTHNIFGYSMDNSNQGSGWLGLGTWSIASGQPGVGTAVPSSGSSDAGASQVFKFTYSSAGGALYLNEALALWNGTVSSAGGCFVQYFVSSNTLYLANDAGTGETGPPLTPGSAGTLSNGQCSISGPGSSVSPSGDTLSLTLSVSFTAAFAGSHNMFGYSLDDSNHGSGWQQIGTWAVVSGLPGVGASAPSSGSSAAGNGQVFTFTYSSPAGASYLNEVLALWNGVVASGGGCFVQYFVATNTLYLANDAGNGETGPPLTPGSAGTLSNSQCAINGVGSSVFSLGNTLSLTLSVDFAAAFAGTHNIFGYSLDNSNQGSGWLQLGDWTVTPH